MFLNKKSPVISQIKKFVCKAKHTALGISLFAGITVTQKADTLQFINDNELIDSWIIARDSISANNGHLKHTQQVKISDNRKYYILYDEYRNSLTDSLTTTLSLYTSQKQCLWKRTYKNDRRIDFARTKIFENDVAITSTDRTYGQPVLEYIHDNTSEILIKKDEWQRLIDFAFSPDMRYVALHVRNPHNRKMWDFIYFIDRKTNSKWTYTFPICISCKRNRIDINVDNEGDTEVIYKEQHRIFDKSGSLVDFFFRLQK